MHPGSSVGYWIPTDANVDDPYGWLSNIDIARFLANIRRASCNWCPTAVFRTRARAKASGRTAHRHEPQRDPDAAFGGAAVLGGEEVLADSALDGHSPFTYHLLRQLGDAKGETPARDMLLSIRDKVSKSSERQVPSYGIIMSSEHASAGEHLLNPTTN